MRQSHVCNSVEGEVLELQCRKFSLQPPRKDPKLGKLIYPFKLSIFGIARITKPLDPHTSATKKTSLLAVGDEVHGEAVDGYGIRPVGRPAVGNATGTHKASFVTVKGSAYAHVEIGVRDHLESTRLTGNK
jgi:hypothetical protein